MADTYHPQQIGLNQVKLTSSIVPADSIKLEIYPLHQLTLTSSIVPADSIKFELYYQIKLTSTQIPLHQEIVKQMELYAPGSFNFWPDDKKPQYRIPAYATMVVEPPVVTSTFPALTLAF